MNKNLIDWVTKHIDKDPYCILSPVFVDYDKHLNNLNKKFSNVANKLLSTGMTRFGNTSFDCIKENDTKVLPVQYNCATFNTSPLPVCSSYNTICATNTLTKTDTNKEISNQTENTVLTTTQKPTFTFGLITSPNQTSTTDLPVTTKPTFSFGLFSNTSSSNCVSNTTSSNAPSFSFQFALPKTSNIVTTSTTCLTTSKSSFSGNFSFVNSNVNTISSNLNQPVNDDGMYYLSFTYVYVFIYR